MYMYLGTPQMPFGVCMGCTACPGIFFTLHDLHHRHWGLRPLTHLGTVPLDFPFFILLLLLVLLLLFRLMSMCGKLRTGGTITRQEERVI